MTPRQKEIAVLVAEGLTNPEIAERLHIACHTVENHMPAIYSYYGVDAGHRGENRVRLAYAIEADAALAKIMGEMI